MINNDNTELNNEISESNDVKKPDEQSGTVVQGFLKIFDPESGEVLVQGRD